jgi:hypothetical protein
MEAKLNPASLTLTPSLLIVTWIFSLLIAQYRCRNGFPLLFSNIAFA